MTTQTLFQKLQREVGSFRAEYLPLEIRFMGRDRVTHTRQLLNASLDEVAFASDLLSEEISVLIQRRAALDDLYAIARHRGALGADLIEKIAEESSK